MKLYSYRIIKFENITKPDSHGKKFQLEAEIIPTEKLGTSQQQEDITKVDGIVELATYPLFGWPELFRRENSNKVIIEENVHKVAYEFGRIYLQKIIQDGEITSTFELTINKNTSPESCPFTLTTIEIDHQKWNEVEVSRPIGF